MKPTPKLPQRQLNANLADGLLMRVGIPHKAGRLPSHAFNQGYAVMVSANAFWHQAKREFVFPECTDLTDSDFAMDSAGFTAMLNWKAKGTQPGMAGVFPWTHAQYVAFATSSGASWWSQPDLCCEPQIASDEKEVEYRVRATATLLEGTLMTLYEWQNQLARSCSSTVVGNMLPPPVPVLQGWSASMYLRSLDLTMAVWDRWQPWLAAPALIGLGSVCRRPVEHPEHGLGAVLGALKGNLPRGSRLHLFGIKGESLSALRDLDWIASADSMAWDLSARIKAHRSGHSNSIEHRSAEMDRWLHSMLHCAVKRSPALSRLQDA